MNTTKTSTENLISALETFPQNWTLTPVHNKAPKIKNWQKGIDRETIIKELETGRANGIGLITGELSGHLLALDIDGPEADKLAEERGGIPHTVKWTSQKPGRYQCLLFVPPEYQDLLKDLTRKVIPTGVKGEQLEIRYKGCQSVLWLSEHPETPGYIVINGLDTPIAEVPVWVIEQILGDNSQLSNPDQLPLNFDNNINNSITPLYNFLSRDDRKLIDNGVLNGSRNDSGAKLSRGLLGAVNRLNYLGYQFDGNPEDLFNTFCDKCNPPLPQKERQTIWKSALKANPTTTLTDDYLENCHNYFQKNQGKKQSGNNSKPSHQTSGTAALKPESQSNVVPFNRQQTQPIFEELETELRKIADQNLPKSKEKSEVLKLSKIFNYNPKEIAEQLQLYKDEFEQKDSQDDIKIELEELLKNRNQTLNLGEYLPGNLAKIGEFSSRLCLRPEIGLTAFLSVVSSLQNVNNDIYLLGYTDFDQPLGLFNAICAEPSQKKSPLINKIATEPLRELQREARKRYEQELLAYEALPDDQKPPEKPVERAYFAHTMSQAGMRNLLNAQSKNGWGILILCDELAGNFKNNKKSYNDGVTEDLLSAYDAFGKREYLKDGWAGDYDRCLLSILGGIQPDVMREFNNGSDSNGKWARFNYLNQPTSPFIIPDNPPAKLDIKMMLTDFYRKIAALPQLNLKLDAKAEKAFTTINNKCECFRVGAKTQALAAQWGKMPGKIGRLAALLHIIHQVALHGTVQSLVVEKSTLDKAVKLARFYLGEAQNLYGECSTENQLAPQLAKILELADKRQTAIGARDIKAFDRSFTANSPDDIRAMFSQLVELGYGEVEGSGTRLKFKIIQTVDNCRQTVDKTVDSETVATQGLQPTVDTVDKKNKNFQNETQNNQSDDITHIDDVVEIPVEPEKMSTASTVPPNAYTEPSTASTEMSTERLQLSTVSMGYGERSPEPIPPSEPLDFDHIKEGDILFDGEGQPHKITGRSRQLWETHRKQYISRNDILQGQFHRANVGDITKLIERTIKGKNKTQAKWLCDVYGGESDSLMAKAIDTNPEELALIFDFDCWE